MPSLNKTLLTYKLGDLQQYLGEIETLVLT